MEKSRVSFYLKDITLNKFNNYCKKNDKIRSKVLEKIINDFLDSILSEEI
ncbi:MAG: hypothetical protein RR662_07180 [Clostridia bacterium]